MKLAIFLCVLAIGSACARGVVGPGAPGGSETCLTSRCMENSTCVMVETTPGHPLEPRCVPICGNPCANYACGPTEQCVLVEVICVQRPCNPVPECRPQELTDVIPFQLRKKRQADATCLTVRCATPGGCALIRPLTCLNPNPDLSCPIHAGCVQANPCAAMRCAAGSQCVLAEVACGQCQCDPIARCEPVMDLRCTNQKNQVWAECGADNQRVCGTSGPIPCSAECQAGCVCKPGYCRNDLGKCVAENRNVASLGEFTA